MSDSRRKQITWLHLSDLHFNTQKHGYRGKEILTKLGQDLRQLVHGKGLTVDLIFVTGDLAYGEGVKGLSLKEQYKTFFDFLKLQMNSLKVPKERVFLVPGNHDVNRSQVGEAQSLLTDHWLGGDEDAVNQKVAAMIGDKNTDWLGFMNRLGDYRQALNEKGYKHLLQDPDRLCYGNTVDLDGFRVGVLGLNGVWSCGRDQEQGKLFLGGREQVARAREELGDVDLTLALMHHPLDWYAPAERKHFKNWFPAQVDFFLHGHEHDTWVRQEEAHTVISAGAGLGESTSEMGYNLVQLDLVTGKGCAWLRNYSDRGEGGWVSDQIPNKTDDRGVWTFPLPARLVTPAEVVVEPEEKDEPVKTAAMEPEATGGGEAASASPVEAPQRETVKVAASVEPPPAPGAAGPRFVGRAQELETLGKALRNQGKVIVLFGLTGVGKSPLVKEKVRRLNRDGDLHKIAFYPMADHRHGDPVADFYADVAHALGLPREYPKEDIAKGRFKFLAKATKRKTILHLEHAQHVFDFRKGFKNETLGALIKAIPVYAAGVTVILESREAPPRNAFGQHQAELIKLAGLSQEAMVDYFKAPFPGTSVSWNFTADQAGQVFQRLGGRLTERDNLAGAHPFAMVLLANLAQDRRMHPAEALQEFKAAFVRDLYQKMFQEIFERVLSQGQSRLLAMCVAYRDKISSDHVGALVKRAGEPEALDRLAGRSLVEEGIAGYFWTVNGLVREMAPSVDDRQAADDHEFIAELWMRNLKRDGAPAGQRTYLDAAEGVYHLIEGGAFFRLAEIAPEFVTDRHLIGKLRATSDRLNREKRPKENVAVLELWCHLEPDSSMAHGLLGSNLDKVLGRGTDQAFEHFQRAWVLNPCLPNNLANLGKAMMARGAARDFLDLLAQGDIVDSAIDDHVRSVQADALVQCGDLAVASALRRERIAAGCRNVIFYAAEAKALAEDRDYDGALAVLDQADVAGVGDEYTAAIRADVLMAMGDLDGAAALRRGKIAGGSRNAAFYAAEAKALAEDRDYAGALAVLDQADAAGVGNEYTAAIRADVLTAMGDREGAAALRRGKIAGGIRNATFYAAEAKALAEDRDYASALAVLDQADAAGVGNEYTAAIRADVLTAKGDREGASALRRGKIAGGTRHPTFYAAEAKALAEDRDYDGALAVLDQAEAAGVGDDYTAAIRSDVLTAKGDREGAAALRRGKIAGGSRNPAFYAAEAKALAEDRDYDGALAVLDQAEAAGVGDDYTAAIRSDVLTAKGDREGAAALRRGKIAGGSRNPAFYAAEAKALAEDRDYDGALAVLDQAEAAGVGDDYTAAIRGDVLTAKGDLEGAAALRRGKIAGGSRNPTFYAAEAKALAEDRDYDGALAVLDQADSLGIGNEVTTHLRRRITRDALG